MRLRLRDLAVSGAAYRTAVVHDRDTHTWLMLQPHPSVTIAILPDMIAIVSVMIAIVRGRQ
jgi:hypothetical protein